MDKEISITHLSCGCDWDGKRWWYCAQHERPDAAPHESHVFGDRFCERCGYAKDTAVALEPCQGSNPNLVAPDPTPPKEEMQDHCPTCGTLMRVVENEAGVFRYGPPSDAAPVRNDK